MWTMSPAALMPIPVTKASTGLRCTIETLVKGCHKLWVTRQRNNGKVAPSRKRQVSKEKEDDISSEFDMLWTEKVFFEAPLSQSSLDDEKITMQDDDEEATHGNGDQIGDDTPNVEEEEVPLQQEDTVDER